MLSYVAFDLHDVPRGAQDQDLGDERSLTICYLTDEQ